MILTPSRSTIPDESSVVAVQIFDQRKFKRRDQGFLGVVNIRVSDVLDLELGGQGVSLLFSRLSHFQIGAYTPAQRCLRLI